MREFELLLLEQMDRPQNQDIVKANGDMKINLECWNTITIVVVVGCGGSDILDSLLAMT